MWMVFGLSKTKTPHFEFLLCNHFELTFFPCTTKEKLPNKEPTKKKGKKGKKKKEKKNSNLVTIIDNDIISDVFWAKYVRSFNL